MLPVAPAKWHKISPMAGTETLDDSNATPRRGGSGARATPGLLLVFCAGRPSLAPLRVADSVVLGRGRTGSLLPDDSLMSRRHAAVSFDGGRWRIEDFGSRNGTFLDGERIQGSRQAPPGARVLRAGGSVFLFCDNVEPYRGAAVEVRGEVVIGPSLRAGWDAVRRAARGGDVLHLSGETGAGKEVAARYFHDAGARRKGPFVAVNCATIPPAIAERILFGARRGTYSGADQDADGYLQTADGGTLFLDEIGDLDSAVQAKLLRVLESREVLPLGATRARKIDFGLVSATHRELRALVDAGRFREDLFFRVARPAVELPPLRTRADELTWLVAHALGEGATALPHASLIEAILLRPWPGNVRELVREVRAAAQAAADEGHRTIKLEHLSPEAGRGKSAGDSSGARASARSGEREQPSRAEVERVLAKLDGNVTGAARALGMHRNQLRRLLARLEIVPRGGDDEE